MGYPKETKGYYFYLPSDNKVFVARFGTFLEREFISKRSSGSKVNLEEIQDPQVNTEPNENGEGVQPISTDEVATVTEPVGEPESEPVTQIRRSARTRNEPERYGFLVTSENDLIVHGDEPTSYQEAMASSDFEKWLEAMKSEMQSMYDNQVWTLIDSSNNLKTIGYK